MHVKMNMEDLRVGAAVGITHDTMERIDALSNAGADVIVIDTAHGHSMGVLKTIKEVEKNLSMSN